MSRPIYATQLGAVRLTEMFGNGAEMAGEGYIVVEHIDQHLLQSRCATPCSFRMYPLWLRRNVHESGRMVMVAKGDIGVPVRGYQVSRADVRRSRPSCVDCH